MKIFQTAERVSGQDASDNYVFQRSLLAYKKAASVVRGRVLEIGTGEGYGIQEVAANADYFETIDKYQTNLQTPLPPNVSFKQMNIPPLKDIPDNSFDFVISFQVIEHIKDDSFFVREVHRVLKKGGKAIIATPNKKMSLTRNPWHIREYTIDEFESLLLKSFSSVEKLGVFGNDKVMKYFEENKKSVERLTKYDFLNLQYRLPRQLLQIPYDILNRWNRKKLLKSNHVLTTGITLDDYFIEKAKDDCIDLFFIAEK